MRRVRHGCSLAVGLSRFDVITPDALSREFADAAPAADGRDQFMAALTIRTRSLERPRPRWRQGRSTACGGKPDRIVVPATETFGVTLELREPVTTA